MEELTAKSVRPGVNIMIVLRRPLVLPHMLGLARREEWLDRRRGARRLIDTPVMRAVAIALVGKIKHSQQETQAYPPSIL
ncbi:hypothetical protein ABH994_002947 [Bradyrhizobium yuanmingense]|uniref:hypothetical protein n=1 Tax=Bradyrhizobium yuanmingense TaxID=108015 RepID=UPI0035195E60